MTQPKKKKETVYRGEDDAPKVYANYLGLLATKGDVRLRFGSGAGTRRRSPRSVWCRTGCVPSSIHPLRSRHHDEVPKMHQPHG